MSEEKNWKQRVLETEIVSGHCPECEMYTILVGLNRSFYRCTNCGADTKQHINGKISYIQLTESDKEWLRKNGREEKR